MENKIDFLQDTKLISYNKNNYSSININSIDDLNLHDDENHNVKWFNTYGKLDRSLIRKIIHNNNLDDFLSVLLFDNYYNKVIAINDGLFVSIEVFREDRGIYFTEKMAFILGKNYIWSIQEKKGDYFGWIRKRIRDDADIIRRKHADYLFFLMLESIVNGYEKAFNITSDYNDQFSDILNVKPTPDFISKIENKKKELLTLKKSTVLLRNIITKLLNYKLINFHGMYFEKIKEQVNNLNVDIDFEVQTLESNINLIFSVQGHYLNEVMKTLTVFSIIFIPITFLSGLYGMNFKYMPELKTQHGYFVLLGFMILITLSIIYYLKRKKWF